MKKQIKIKAETNETIMQPLIQSFEGMETEFAQAINKATFLAQAFADKIGALIPMKNYEIIISLEIKEDTDSIVVEV